MSRSLYRGFMVATTSTQYIYIVENSTVLLNQHNSEEGGDVTEGVGGGAVREGNPVVLITEGSSSSGSNSGVVPPQGGRHDVGSGAVFYKHAHVATSAVSATIIVAFRCDVLCYILE